MDFSEIPPEVLPYIFKYLPLEDRKNVRLTCSLWKDSCNCAEIVTKEKFVFRQGTCGDSVPALGNCILKCKTFHTDVEFHGLPVSELPSAVWQYFGGRIQSLFLYHCRLGDEVIGNIIAHCPNLISLTVHISRSPKHQFEIGEGVFCSEHYLDDLIARRIEHRKLVTLELGIILNLSNEKCRKLFRVFPCLKTFSQGDWTFYADFYAKSVERGEPDDEWKFPSSIENFMTNLMDVRAEFWKWPKLRFKGFANMFRILPSDLIFEFFSEQTELEIVHLLVRPTTRQERNLGKELFFHLLNQLPKLKELEYHYCHELLDFTTDEFGDFLVKTSRMESLKLSFRSRCNWVEVSLPSTQYTNLKRLQLNGYGSEKFSLEVLNRCCKSLTYLSVFPVNDEIMQRIFDFHTDLQTLCINLYFLRYSSYSNQSVKYSFKQLPSLQHLEIHGLSLDHVLRSAPVIEFDFPKLKYLCIEFKTNVQKQDLRNLLDIVSFKAPRLEILRYSENLLYANQLAYICKRLKNLRFLIIDNLRWPRNVRKWPVPYRKYDKNLEKLFIECPSLYAVTCLDVGISYVYDHFSKKLKYYHNFTVLPHENSDIHDMD